MTCSSSKTIKQLCAKKDLPLEDLTDILVGFEQRITAYKHRLRNLEKKRPDRVCSRSNFTQLETDLEKYGEGR